jgi:hypothetical protein
VPHEPPSWTDENEHDPGVVLLELLAYSVIGFALAYWWLRWTREGSRRSPHKTPA